MSLIQRFTGKEICPHIRRATLTHTHTDTGGPGLTSLLLVLISRSGHAHKTSYSGEHTDMCVVITLSHTGLSGEVGFYTVSGRVCVCVRACVVDTRRKVCDMMRTNELRDSDEQEEVQP